MLEDYVEVLLSHMKYKQTTTKCHICYIKMAYSVMILGAAIGKIENKAMNLNSASQLESRIQVCPTFK